LLSAGGQTWRFSPDLGDLTYVDAGFGTNLGTFAVSAEMVEGGALNMNFSAPQGTTGDLSVPYPKSGGRITLREVSGAYGVIVMEITGSPGPGERIEVQGLEGGEWEVRFEK